MLLRKKLASAFLTLVIASQAIPMTSKTTSAISQLNFAQSFYERVMNEKAKYPEKVNGQQCYWNSTLESYSTTPCVHGSNGAGVSCCGFYPSWNLYDEEWNPINERSYDHGYIIDTKYLQCAGFAAKLGMDITGSRVFVRYQIDANGYITYSDGTKKLYTPQKGDSLRITWKKGVSPHHSIFVTEANGSYITFAQCNADSKCGIDWDQTKSEYTDASGSKKMLTMTYSNIRTKFAVGGYVDRVTIGGDINLDGDINEEDVALFDSTIKTNGDNFNCCPLVVYDVTQDGYIDEVDYNRIKYMSGSAFQSLEIIGTNIRSVTSRWQTNYTDNAFLSNGAYYVSDGNGELKFIGILDQEVTSFTVPETVLNPETGTYQKVTSIGNGSGRPGDNTYSSLTNITLSPNVKKINNYAFYGANLKTLSFSGTKALTTIEDYAFLCSKLTALDLTSCANLRTIGKCAFESTAVKSVSLPSSLRTIGDYAFRNCTSMTAFRQVATSSGICSLANVGTMVFANCPVLTEISIPRGVGLVLTEGGTFDASSNGLTKVKFKNSSSTSVRKVFLGQADIDLIKSGKVQIYGSNCKIYDLNLNLLATNTSTTLKKLTLK